MRIAGMLLLSGLTLATAAEMGRGAPALMRDSTTHALPDGERRMSEAHRRLHLHLPQEGGGGERREAR